MDDTRNLMLGLICILGLGGSSGCKFMDDTGPGYGATTLQQDTHRLLELVPEDDGRWQENGGDINRLILKIIINGVGEPQLDRGRQIEWIKKAGQYWETNGRAIMEQHLESGHPSAKLWDETGRKFYLGHW